MLKVTPTIEILEKDLEFQFVRSGGPGGQNVNKVATTVILRFDLRNTDSLEEEVKKRLIKIVGRKYSKEGHILLYGRRFRSQDKNRQDTLNRLKELILRALEEPKPRKKTKKPRAAIEERLKKKKILSDKKRGRQKVDHPPRG